MTKQKTFRLIMFTLVSVCIFVLLQNLSINAESITDVMGDWGNTNNPDGETMQEATSWVSKYLGTALSVLLYVIFALTTLVTAIDLAYIGLPMTRTFLYTGGQTPNTSGVPTETQSNKEVCYISRDLKCLIDKGLLKTNTVKSSVLTYMKTRAVNIVIMVVILLVLVTTSVFTDMGLNIGQAILDFLGF